MKPVTTDPRLKEQLDKAIALDNIYQSADFQNHLLPAFQKLAQVQLIDPTTYTSREEFARHAEMAFTIAITYQDILKLLSSQKDRMEAIRKQMAIPAKNWSQ